MANDNIQLREPEIFAAGDTLSFERYFPEYLPSNGWSLEYVLTDLDGNQKSKLASTADNDRHKIYQDNFASGFTHADYIFSGYAVNGAERHRIYQGVFTLVPDFEDVAAAGPVQTEAQEMCEMLKNQYKTLAQFIFSETDVQRNRLLTKQQDKVLEDWKYWKEARINEVRAERARNGQPSGSTVIPVLNIG